MQLRLRIFNSIIPPVHLETTVLFFFDCMTCKSTSLINEIVTWYKLSLALAFETSLVFLQIYLKPLGIKRWWIMRCVLNWFVSSAISVVRTGRMPKHVAVIMDGNRRYAKKKKIANIEVYANGYDKMMKMLGWCKRLGITEMTTYAFSIDNLKRSKKEVDEFMKLSTEVLASSLEKDELMEEGICVRFIGNLSLISEDLRRLIAKIMIATKNNNEIFLNIAFAYDSRDEITHAIKDILKAVKRNDILPEDIDENLVSNCLYTYNSPNPDLLIRTSGENRLSYFLMWQVSNTCIYFVDVLWPEFNVWHFLKVIFCYQRYYSHSETAKKLQNTKTITPNSRVSKYLDKLYRERQNTVENMHSPADES